ncbi:MAG: type 1 glutamine amidotransferase [Myxococcota bacterium]
MTSILIQARNPSDIARTEEIECFARQIGCQINDIISINIATQSIDMSVLETADAVLIGGAGEFSVLDNDPRIHRFIDAIGQLCTMDRPVFGSCFGFQAMVLALGGEVIKDVPNAEVGTYELYKSKDAENDVIFEDFPSQFLAQLGHQDRASVLPNSVINLAYSNRAPYQAIKIPNKAIYATQFHPELRAEDNALRFSRYMPIYGKLFGEAEAQARMDSHRSSPQANQILGRFYREFVQ